MERMNRAENLQQMHIYSSKFLERAGESKRLIWLNLWCRNTIENCVSIKNKNICLYVLTGKMPTVKIADDKIEKRSYFFAIKQ